MMPGDELRQPDQPLDEPGSARAEPTSLLAADGAGVDWIAKFEEELSDDITFEKSLLRKELLIIAVIAVFVAIRGVLLL